MQRSRLQRASKANNPGNASTTTTKTTTTTTTPIRSMEAGPLFLECWVEQGKRKDSLSGNTTAATLASRETLVQARKAIDHHAKGMKAP